MTQKNIRTRMAPSPTGEMHVGSMATLLKNYAFAKKHGGKFILRIEDTDRTRLVENGVQDILDIIKAYGLSWDEGPYVQSERLELYQKYAKKLVAEGKAYYCFCSRERLEEVRKTQQAAKQPPRYDRHCLNLNQKEIEQKLAQGESAVIRLKVPQNQTIKFTDLIRGEISFNSSEVDDQVLLKSDGYPTYHLAVVIDDHLMKISHIMRGEEWISSTPKHILLYEAFGWTPPVYAHMPVFLNPDGKGKMSKRKGTVSARSFLEKGYLPEALLNFFMILGWTPKDQREILSLDEYINEFDPKDLSKNSVVFDLKKLAWLNGIYIRKLSQKELASRINKFLPVDFPKDKLFEILPLVSERLVTLADIEDLTSFFFRKIKLDRKLLLKKANQNLVSKQLKLVLAGLEKMSNWELNAIEQVIRDLQEQHDWHKGQFFMMLRVATTGSKVSPPLFETIQALGQAACCARLKAALNLIANQ